MDSREFHPRAQKPGVDPTDPRRNANMHLLESDIDATANNLEQPRILNPSPRSIAASSFQRGNPMSNPSNPNRNTSENRFTTASTWSPIHGAALRGHRFPSATQHLNQRSEHDFSQTSQSRDIQTMTSPQMHNSSLHGNYRYAAPAPPPFSTYTAESTYSPYVSPYQNQSLQPFRDSCEPLTQRIERHSIQKVTNTYSTLPAGRNDSAIWRNIDSNTILCDGWTKRDLLSMAAAGWMPGDFAALNKLKMGLNGKEWRDALAYLQLHQKDLADHALLRKPRREPDEQHHLSSVVLAGPSESRIPPIHMEHDKEFEDIQENDSQISFQSGGALHRPRISHSRFQNSPGCQHIKKPQISAPISQAAKSDASLRGDDDIAVEEDNTSDESDSEDYQGILIDAFEQCLTNNFAANTRSYRLEASRKENSRLIEPHQNRESELQSSQLEAPKDLSGFRPRTVGKAELDTQELCATHNTAGVGVENENLKKRDQRVLSFSPSPRTKKPRIDQSRNPEISGLSDRQELSHSSNSVMKRGAADDGSTNVVKEQAMIDPSTNHPYTDDKLKAIMNPYHTPKHPHNGKHILIFRGPEKPDLPILCKLPKYCQTRNFIISKDALFRNSKRFREMIKFIGSGKSFDEAIVWNPAKSKTKKPFLKDLTFYFTGMLEACAKKGDLLAQDILTFNPTQIFDVSLGTWFVFVQRNQFIPGSSPWEKERTLKIGKWIGATDDFMSKVAAAPTRAKHILDNEEMDILEERGHIIKRLAGGGYEDMGKRA